MPAPRRFCPDGGTCHHDCGAGPCFRVRTCGPLSGVFVGDRWPDELVKAHLDSAPELPNGITVELLADALLSRPSFRAELLGAMANKLLAQSGEDAPVPVDTPQKGRLRDRLRRNALARAEGVLTERLVHALTSQSEGIVESIVTPAFAREVIERFYAFPQQRPGHPTAGGEGYKLLVAKVQDQTQDWVHDKLTDIVATLVDDQFGETMAYVRTATAQVVNNAIGRLGLPKAPK